jgi:hypothetical protein
MTPNQLHGDSERALACLLSIALPRKITGTRVASQHDVFYSFMGFKTSTWTGV